MQLLPVEPKETGRWNLKKLGESHKASMQTWCCIPVGEEERMATAGFARVKRSSKSLQGTIEHSLYRNFNQLARVNPQAQEDTIMKPHLFDFNKDKCTCSWESWLWHLSLMSMTNARNILLLTWKGVNSKGISPSTISMENVKLGSNESLGFQVDLFRALVDCTQSCWRPASSLFQPWTAED